MATYIYLQPRSGSRGARWAVAAVLSGSLLARAPAHAAPNEADRTTARELASEGYRALERKEYAVAEDRFRRADALVHAPTIVVDHARALVGLGRLVEAYERYALVIREGVTPEDPESWKRAVSDAEREIETVRPRLAWLTLNIEGPKEPNVTIDGRVIPVASLGARRAADPGRRKIRVTADGYVSGGRIVYLREGQEQEISLALVRPPSVELEETAETTSDDPSRPNASSPLPFIAFGVGGVGLGVGVVTGLMALGARSDLDASCPSGVCVPNDERDRAALQRDLDRYHSLGTISGIGFGVGLAGAITGTVLLVTGSSGEGEAAAIAPVAGPGFVGVRGRL